MQFTPGTGTNGRTSSLQGVVGAGGVGVGVGEELEPVGADGEVAGSVVTVGAATGGADGAVVTTGSAEAGCGWSYRTVPCWSVLSMVTAPVLLGGVVSAGEVVVCSLLNVKF